MATTYVSEFLATAGTVTIKVYNQKGGVDTEVSTDNDSCPENGSTGQYQWDMTNITTVPTPYQEYAYVMTDGSESRAGIMKFDDFLIQYIIHENMEI